MTLQMTSKIYSVQKKILEDIEKYKQKCKNLHVWAPG